MKKSLKIILSITIILCATISSFVLVYFYCDSYPEFYAIATKSFSIPGLETTFVPQGLDFDNANNKFLVTGYMSSGEPSRLYIVDKQTNLTEKYVTFTSESNDYIGHCGGVAIDGDYGWIVGDKMLYRFNYSSVLTAENGDKIEFVDSFATGNGCDFVLVKNGKLIVGEFYKAGKYDTPTSHHLQINEAETNYALAYVYTIEQANDYGLLTQTPEAGISLPNQVQGMNFTKDGNIVLSTSYSIPNSQILIYENVLNSTPQFQITLNDKTLPVYALSSQNKLKTISACAMSEELVLVDDKVYLLFESACSKYRLINREKLYNVYALDI